MTDDREYRGQDSRVLGQDGFSLRLGTAPKPRQVTSAPAVRSRLAFSENGDGSLTLVRCLDAQADDMNISFEAGERPVTAIAPHAFEGCRALVRVGLPQELRQIGEMAFLGCQHLRRIVIPGSVERVGTLAFARCSGLTQVRLQPGVRALGPSSFSKCSSLVRVDIPDTVRSFGGGVFFGCGRGLVLYGAENSAARQYAALNGLAFDAEAWRQDEHLLLEEMEDGTLCVCGLRDAGAIRVEIPEELCGRRISAIAPKAFFGNRVLEQATIGAGVAVIGESAFMGCTALELCTFERGLTEIGPSAFAGCEHLVQAVLPWGLRVVRRMAFFGCTRLGFVKMPNDTLVEGLAFEGCGPALRVFGGRQEDRTESRYGGNA
ncbi:MAG: leucine-rich repeat domain-containing protein [Clostridia bacterium]|nr:leucine-rich repeat domain-containing protein [Clostridia bacterium]